MILIIFVRTIFSIEYVSMKVSYLYIYIYWKTTFRCRVQYFSYNDLYSIHKLYYMYYIHIVEIELLKYGYVRNRLHYT